MQSYYFIGSAVILLILYFRRQVRGYQERQVGKSEMKDETNLTYTGS